MIKTQPSPYNLFKNKEIIAILDGDKELGEFNLDDGDNIKLKMPYLSGPDLCSLSALFGFPQTYAGLSRWQYLDNLLDYSIKNNRCSDLLAHMFSKGQFSKTLNGYSADIVDSCYQKIINEAINEINGLLYFGGNELTIIGQQYVVKKIGSKVEVLAPKIKSIDREYIKSISTRANQDIEQRNFDSAITKSRTLLEETFCYVIEKKGDTPSTSGNIAELYKQVKNHYNMHTNANLDKRVNTLLSGLEKIISAISEMRNKDSDVHGVGAARINIDEHHARLFINSAISMADFILSVENNSNSKQ